MYVKSEMAECQIFHEQILTLVREEMQEQGMKLVGAYTQLVEEERLSYHVYEYNRNEELLKIAV